MGMKCFVDIFLLCYSMGAYNDAFVWSLEGLGRRMVVYQLLYCPDGRMTNFLLRNGFWCISVVFQTSRVSALQLHRDCTVLQVGTLERKACYTWLSI